MKNNKYQDVYFYKFLRPIITILFKILFSKKIKGQDNILVNTENG